MCGADDDDKKEQEWLRCGGCSQWFHESCAEDCGILDDKSFTCKNRTVHDLAVNFCSNYLVTSGNSFCYQYYSVYSLCLF